MKKKEGGNGDECIKGRGEEDDQFFNFINEWILWKNIFGLTYCDGLFSVLIWVYHSTQVFCLYTSVSIIFKMSLKFKPVDFV